MELPRILLGFTGNERDPLEVSFKHLVIDLPVKKRYCLTLEQCSAYFFNRPVMNRTFIKDIRRLKHNIINGPGY